MAEHTHRIRYPDPLIKVNDTIKINLKTGEFVVRHDTITC